MRSFYLRGFETVVWVFIPTVGIIRKKLQVVMLMAVPTAVHFRNLERTSEKTGMTYFPSFLFFIITYKRQPSATATSKQCSGKGL